LETRLVNIWGSSKVKQIIWLGPFNTTLPTPYIKPKSLEIKITSLDGLLYLREKNSFKNDFIEGKIPLDIWGVWH
jgi:hypothetical protein